MIAAVAEASWPKPDTLTAESALGLVHEIRCKVRPAIISELRTLYSGRWDSLENQVDICALEVQLQKVDRYLWELNPRLGSDGAGWDEAAPDLSNVLAHGSMHATATCGMLVSPENLDCVHGPYSIVPIASLAEHILEGAERLSMIETVSWLRPMRNQARLAISDASAGSIDSLGAAITGRFKTTSGRLLDFSATESEEPIVRQAGYNSLSLSLVADSLLQHSPGGSGIRIDLNPSGIERARKAMVCSRPLFVATILDLVPVAILNWRKETPMLDCGYRAVKLPANPEEVFAPGAALEVWYKEKASYRSERSGLWIARYGFSYGPGETASGEMTMAEANDVRTILRKVHS